MAEQNESRTERASARRKADARKKGQVALSRDVPTAAVLLTGALVLYFLAGAGVNRMAGLMREWFARVPEITHQEFGREAFQSLMHVFTRDALTLIMPMSLAVAATGTGAYLVQTGLLWRAEGVQMDPSRLNPLEGLRRLVSLRALAELVKAILKIGLITAAAYWSIRDDVARLPDLIQYDLQGLLAVSADLGMNMALWIAMMVAVIAAADYAYQRFEWERSLKMTPEEVKQEQREAEGDPLLRSRVRSVQREMVRNRMIAAVPQADVVVTNPTHVAVALQYDHKTMTAPVVLAKGAGFIAERIKAVAKEHGVMVVENKIVARTLYQLVEVGREVPADLYRAVAEVLAYVYRARGRRVD
ncbi:MAG: flagellar biosynthesis protein FlhB [Nitrospiraceae bacterium]